MEDAKIDVFYIEHQRFSTKRQYDRMKIPKEKGV